VNSNKNKNKNTKFPQQVSVNKLANIGAAAAVLAFVPIEWSTIS